MVPCDASVMVIVFTGQQHCDCRQYPIIRNDPGHGGRTITEELVKSVAITTLVAAVVSLSTMVSCDIEIDDRLFDVGSRVVSITVRLSVARKDEILRVNLWIQI